MGWTNELYSVYELASKDPGSGLLPISHERTKAQIELVIDERGNFRGAYLVSKNEADTVHPVTVESAGRTSKAIRPHPLADQLRYIAGDYSEYVKGEDVDNSEHFHKYMEQLKSWKDSEHTHTAVAAVYSYLEKATLMKDLIGVGILKIDQSTGKLLLRTETKQGIKYKAPKDLHKMFVRFVVQYEDLTRAKFQCTWLDPTLHDSFINFNAPSKENCQLCYATGKELPVTYNHPKKIVNSQANAKLLSSNDNNGFTFRGRFESKEEAFSVSYDFSQKMHNALKWLIQKQGHSFDTLTLVIWASALEELPDELGKSVESEWDDEEYYDSLPLYKDWLQKYIMGFKQDFTNDTKVMIMGLDVAKVGKLSNSGRLSISLYDELRGSEFLQNLEKWHENSAWNRYDYKNKRNCVKSFSLIEIVRIAYGTVQQDMADNKKQKEQKEKETTMFRTQMLRLLPCVMNGRSIPYDLVRTICNKASNPLAYKAPNRFYDTYVNTRYIKVLEAACGMYRAYKKGDIPLAYDPNETNRSYLYGCLLAIADKAESDTYEKGEERKSRVTNARRYWVNFAQHPSQTWKNIEEHLIPYLNKNQFRSSVERQLREVMDKFTSEAFSDNTRLEPTYLLGYHHYMSHMYEKIKEAE